jgi:hypothetical protein
MNTGYADKNVWNAIMREGINTSRGFCETLSNITKY